MIVIPRKSLTSGTKRLVPALCQPVYNSSFFIMTGLAVFCPDYFLPAEIFHSWFCRRFYNEGPIYFYGPTTRTDETGSHTFILYFSSSHVMAQIRNVLCRDFQTINQGPSDLSWYAGIRTRYTNPIRDPPSYRFFWFSLDPVDDRLRYFLTGLNFIHPDRHPRHPRYLRDYPLAGIQYLTNHLLAFRSDYVTWTHPRYSHPDPSPVVRYVLRAAQRFFERPHYQSLHDLPVFDLGIRPSGNVDLRPRTIGL